MTCPGSVALCAAVPSAPSSAAAAEGTAAHWVAEQHLLEAAGRKFEQPVINLPCPENGVKVTLDMVTHSRWDYVNYIHKTIGDDAMKFVAVERKFNLEWVWPGMFGTCDAASAFDHRDDTLHVFDFKYGAGLPVCAVDNPQLAFYALGAADSLFGKTWPERVRRVVCHIVQPRISHIPDIWELDSHGLTLWVSQFRNSAAATEDPDAPRIYSKDGCQFCDAAEINPDTGKPYCDVLYEKQIELAHKATMPLVSLSTMTAQDISDELSLFELAKSVCSDRLESLQIWGSQLADNTGIDIPGRKLVFRRSKRKWRDAEEVIAVFRFGMGLTDEQIFSSEVISPAQAEKLRDDNGCKIIAPDVISAYTEKADNGVELVPADDKRPAVAARARLADYVLPEGLTPFVNEEK